MAELLDVTKVLCLSDCPVECLPYGISAVWRNLLLRVHRAGIFLWGVGLR
jgi:hypothetical protein